MRKTLSAPVPFVVVQHIEVVWSKRSRGGEPAKKRNAVPEAFAFPKTVAPPEGQVLYHKLWCTEGQQFAPYKPSVKTMPLSPDIRFGCIGVELRHSSLVARYRYGQGCSGLPQRVWVDTAFEIGVGEWVQFAYNGRFTYPYEEEWYYEKHVVNVALINALDSHVFLFTPPKHNYRLLGHLF